MISMVIVGGSKTILRQNYTWTNMFKAVQSFKSHILNRYEVLFSGSKTPLTQMTYTMMLKL